MFVSFAAGLGLGLSLIVAIGAQNAFVLRQGLRRRHVGWVCLTCALSDAVLIVAGVAGFGHLADQAPWFGEAMRYGGALFLLLYGAQSFYNAWTGGGRLDAAEGADEGLVPVLLTVLALTWLNPHVYLDTVVLLGSISAQYSHTAMFALGAVCASFSFFFGLGFGARVLAPVFARPRAWQLLDMSMGLVMWALAAKLILM